jgi:hypothetical protein
MMGTRVHPLPYDPGRAFRLRYWQLWSELRRDIVAALAHTLDATADPFPFAPRLPFALGYFVFHRRASGFAQIVKPPYCDATQS